MSDKTIVTILTCFSVCLGTVFWAGSLHLENHFLQYTIDAIALVAGIFMGMSIRRSK